MTGRPTLIAECCQNHGGDRGVLQRMVHQAAEAGADYVKLQSIRSRDLTFRERFEHGEDPADAGVGAIKRPYGPELERLAGLDLTLDDEAWFVDECRRAGVASMTTVFTRAVVAEVRELGYDAAKVASYDCASLPLLADVRRWWSTLFVSTGATFDDEVEQAARILAGSEYTLLHCITVYPTPLEELHLRRLGWLRRFTPRVGYSDHTRPAETGLFAAKLALALGATCVERHFTVLPADETRDGPVSITPAQLHELRLFADLSRAERMARIRDEHPDWERTLGSATRPLSADELRNRDYYRGRFASRLDGRVVFNWEEDAALDALTAGR